MTDRPNAEIQRELLAAATARRERDRALSMGERLERVHQLCAQLARLAPVRPKPKR